ncbi:cupin domain-containing protein [bacterium]|nr:cupin domain-containing protein [bacterium]
MEKIIVKKPTKDDLQKLGVNKWEIWTCNPSTFDWTYSEKETCYLLEGKVTVKTPSEETSFGAGDLVTFPSGLKCTWKVQESVKKHYRFG